MGVNNYEQERNNLRIALREAETTQEESETRIAEIEHKLTPNKVRCLVARLLALVPVIPHVRNYMTTEVVNLPDESITDIIEGLPKLGEEQQDSWLAEYETRKNKRKEGDL